ncbi:MAG: amidase [Acidobacteriota bacterium]|nr:amidase [Acidobacteriota bacterium]
MYRLMSVMVCGLLVLSSKSIAQPNLLEASIEDLQDWLSSGEITSVELVGWYQQRINAYDQQGPSLNAIQHHNGNVLAQAKVLDDERTRSGPRSLLHGIPVLVKDNYETIDMPTTAGSAIIDGHWPQRDATQVARLKAAGAIILAKTTMHEFAYGWTTRGSAFGVTRNPYGPDRHPGGSSGGTGAAVAANFAAVGMGSDTCGSIRVPAAHNNLVGLRGTQGISSRTGIVPLSSSRDIGGPLARSVRDLAITLDATVGYDPLDVQTVESFGKIPDSYLNGLRQLDMSGWRIGVLTDWFATEPENGAVNERIRGVLTALADDGASIIRLTSPELIELKAKTSAPAANFVDAYDLKKDLTAYLQQYPALPVQSFVELATDQRLSSDVVPLWEEMMSPSYDSRETYLERHADGKRMRTELLTLYQAHNLDILAYPTATREAAKLGETQQHFNCKLAAVSGLPAISVPAGFGNHDMPVAIEFMAEPWGEQKLLNLAYTVEQLVPARKLSKHTP